MFNQPVCNTINCDGEALPLFSSLSSVPIDSSSPTSAIISNQSTSSTTNISSSASVSSSSSYYSSFTSNCSTLSSSSYDTIGSQNSYGLNLKSNCFFVHNEESTDQILDKLEQAGKVPSKEKFRRMACNVCLPSPLPISLPLLINFLFSVLDLYLHWSLSLQRPLRLSP